MPDLWMDVDAALAEVPINVLPLVDDTDFKTIETGVAYNAAGMDLRWNFVTTAGAQTTTAVVPTTAGVHDWTEQADGLYSLEIPASAGTINNDTEGFGWFSGVITGILPFRGPTIGFRAASINNTLVDDTAGPATTTQIDAIGAASGGSVNINASEDNTGGAIIDGVTFVGSVQSGTYASTEAEDGVLHDIDDTANDIDIVYGFAVGGGRTSTEVTFAGFVQGGSDEMKIKAYDHVGADWEIIGTVDGTNGTTNQVLSLPLLLKHTGTGSELGNVYIRFDTDSTTPSNLSVDKLLVSAVNIGQTVGYSLGSIWVDTNNGTAGTESFVNGVADNPVDSIADAFTLSAAVGIPDFHLFNGSSITLAASAANESFFGDHWTLALGGQACGGIHVEGASVSGIGTSTGEEMQFEGCDISTASLQYARCEDCGFSGTVTQTIAGSYNYFHCFAKSDTTPVFTKTAGQAVTVEFIDWHGDITISGLESGDTVVLDGVSHDITLNGADATVEIYGEYESLTNNLTGSPTVNIGGAFMAADIASTLLDTGTTIPATLGTPAADISADIAAAKADTAAILVDTADMQPKLGTPAADISADIAAAKVDTAAILVDTADMQPKLGTPAADISADIAAAKVDTAAILVDTADMQPKLGTPSADISADIAAISTGASAVMVDTTIATLASQVSFTLTAGSADNSAYPVGSICVITDATTATQQCVGYVSAYTGSTKTVTLAADPGIFTIAATDKIRILANNTSANLEEILGTAITETTAGRWAGNASVLFDNGDSASTKIQDNIGSGVISGTIDANVIELKGTAITETTAGRLAANASTILDNADAATTKTADDIGTATFSGTVDANLTQALGTAITETTAGRWAQNASVLFDNADAASAQTQDDIGSAVVSGTVTANVTQVKGTALTETSAGNLADNISQFYDLDTTTTKTVNDVDQATVTGTIDANLVSILSTTIAETSAGNIAANWDEFWDNDDDGASAVTLQTIQDIDDTISGIAGAGAYTVTINVKDTETTPANLENANVRMTEGVNVFVAQTDASGNAVFALDAATYSYAITKAGYTSETGSTVVTATATFNYDIAQAAITPAAGSDTSTGVLTCYDETYTAEVGVVFSMQMTAGPGVAGDSLDTKVITATSDGSGLVQFTGLVRGATYNLWRSSFTTSSVFGDIATANAKVVVTVPDSASFSLPEVIGADE